MKRRKHQEQKHGGHKNDEAHKQERRSEKKSTEKRSKQRGFLDRLTTKQLQTTVIILAVLVLITTFAVGYVAGQQGVFKTGGGSATQTVKSGAPASTPPPQGVVKSDKPKAELFIMSYCPFGLQMQKAWLQVEELLGKKADMSVKFVNYAMHGLKEVVDNTHEYCIQKEEPEKWTAFERCFVETTNYDECADKVGLDKAKIQACYDATDKEFGIMESYNDKSSWLSGRFPPYKVYDALNKQYGVRGSPTLVINGKQVSVPRSAEAVKEAICSAFTNPPNECSQQLSTKQEQPGPGPVGAGASPGAAAPSAGCGA